MQETISSLQERLSSETARSQAAAIKLKAADNKAIDLDHECAALENQVDRLKADLQQVKGCAPMGAFHLLPLEASCDFTLFSVHHHQAGWWTGISCVESCRLYQNAHSDARVSII